MRSMSTSASKPSGGSELGRSAMETICAFANEPGLGGGTLLLGVERDEADFFLPWQIVGVEQPDRLSAELASRCANDFNVPVRIDVRSEAVQDKVLLVVTVPEAQPGDKPVYFKSRGLPRGALRRIGSTDQECTEEDLLVLYQGRQIESFDATLMPDAQRDDIDPDAMADYRQRTGDHQHFGFALDLEIGRHWQAKTSPFEQHASFALPLAFAQQHQPSAPPT